MKTLLQVAGVVTLMFSPLAIDVVNSTLHSERTHVQTSRGRTLVQDWDNSRGREVMTGGCCSAYVYGDRNKDGIVDSKIHYFGTPRRGVFVTRPQVTEEDQRFFDEAVAKSYE